MFSFSPCGGVNKGQFNEAIVFADELEQEAIKQIQELCNQEMFAGHKIRIMPDAQQGMGCVIGFTVNITDKIIPNLVGVDIGCGMLTVELGKISIDFESLDYYIRNQMKDVWTSSIKQSTLDEAADAYKSIEFILKHIDDTVEVISVIKPLYNFKAN